MILAAAVCPHPPMLVVGVAPGTTSDTADLLEASDAAVTTLLGAAPDRIVVLGTGDLVADRDESAGGTLAAYGVDAGGGGADHVLPLSLTVGAWLLDRAGWTGPRTYSTGHPEVDGRVGLLVMADGSAKRSLQAPGYLDERSEAFDAGIAGALGGGDASALVALDTELGVELWAAGVPALRTFGRLALADLQKGATVTAQLRVDEAPFGVGYFVADWTFG